MLRFAHSSLFHLLWLLPLLVVFLVLAFKSKRRAMARFGALELMKKLSSNTSPDRQVAKSALLLLATIFIILALARPQIGTKIEEVKREGVDVLVAIDVSKSMLARDVPPSRLDKAKHEVESFIARLRGDRIGLIAFAGVAFVQCPLTLDYGAAKIFLDIMAPDLIPVPGTAVGLAIQKAIETFDQQERKYKVLVLITDGEDHGEDVIKFAEEAERQGIVIYTVGIGSPQGEPIPETVSGSGFKKDRQGSVVITKLDEFTLEKIALQTGGKYFRASGGEEELDKIYDEIARMEKKELGSLQFSQFEDRFQYLLIVALILIAIEFIFPERLKVKKEWRGRFM
ncbi:VWA domain-containing protein [candidate division KSB1 bacterium]|nr:VWA domain-containing protein [candidate division KSB1 bacterium]RQW04247.1 MAG: VWA domain-containing protein [candidate division KSB1 bacterium]